ncbi:MAG: UbiA family prenyltransferase [Pirellulaceae bacterium]
MEHDEVPSSKVSPSDLGLDQLEWGRLEDWVQLVRFPTTFTLLSGTMSAAIVAGQGWLPLSAFLPTVLASLAVYWAGMILNDVVDIEEDRLHRPKRPLAAGKISPVIAGHVGTALLMLAPIVILGVTAMHSSQPLWQGVAFLAAVLLSLCVRVYDSSLKSTLLGPILMAGCRGLNILMVGCTMLAVSDIEVFPLELAYFAGGIALYICGITVFAKSEELDAKESGNLVLGLLLQAAGLIVIALLPRWATAAEMWYLDPLRYYPLLIGLIGMTVANRAFQAIRSPISRNVILAVKHALLTLILIDAAVALMWCGPWFGGVVVALLVPALFMAISVRST